MLLFDTFVCFFLYNERKCRRAVSEPLDHDRSGAVFEFGLLDGYLGSTHRTRVLLVQPYAHTVLAERVLQESSRKKFNFNV
jgi:hypothetical protein